MDKSKKSTSPPLTGKPFSLVGLRIARVVWIAFALIELVLFIGGIVAYATQLQTTCTNTNRMTCAFWQPTQGNAHALAHLGLSLSAYAAYFLTIDVLVSLVFWAVGILIFWRKSDTWIGLFVSFILCMFGGSGISDSLLSAVQTPYAPPVAMLLFQLLNVLPLGVIQWLGLGLFLLTFPDGRLVPRWSWIILLLWLIQYICFALSLPLNMLHWPMPLFFATVIPLTYGSTLAVQIVRYVRVYDQVQRQQTKWLLFGLAIFLLLNTVYQSMEGLVPDFSNPDSLYQLADGTVTALLFVIIPIAVGVAILRYRLWDIDIIIKRTLIYGTLSVSLVLIYAGLIIGLQFLLQGVIGRGNPLIIVASTLAIAALFQPLRHRIQILIDRRFYRHKYNRARTLEIFSATLQHEVELTQLSEQLLSVVNDTMQPTHVSLWLRPSQHETRANAEWQRTPSS